MNCQDQPKKSLKRKCAFLDHNALTPKEKKAKIEAFRNEINRLLGFYREMMNQKMGIVDLNATQLNSMNARIGVLLEESELPLSKLVHSIYEKVKETGDNVTPASVKSSVLYAGQRMMYGVPNADADVIEDESETSLWCWETRDLKLMPNSARGALQIRRNCRKQIQERIAAVSEMITALEKAESDQNYKQNLKKASVKLDKALSETNIRLLVDIKLQKNGADTAEKEAKRQEKLLIKQLERHKREVEKDKKKIDRELREKLQSEKEIKRLQEAGKDEKHREKEEPEMRKQPRRQQEETEKDKRRREKGEAELKKQVAIQKQASILERFLKRNNPNSSCQNHQSLSNVTTSVSSSKKSEKMPDAVTLLMDCVLSSDDRFNTDDIRKVHLSSWRYLGHSIRANGKQNWGIRRKPKTVLFKELKLSSNRVVRDGEINTQGCEEQISNVQSYHTDTASSFSDVKNCKRKQLLQFAKSYRPAFYGIWPKKSHVVGSRHPLRKDPDLDYEIDSDEEWEEEDPGESLSDCDKDDEEENLEEGCSKADDEDESEDGFFVPDGYLSENEGVQVDRMEIDLTVDENRSFLSLEQDLENKELCALLGQQKYLHNLTEQALRKNQPLIISNLMHEKAPFLLSQDLSGTPRLEQMCLQALIMCAFPGESPVEISMNNLQDDDQEACLSISKAGCSTPLLTVIAIPDSDLPTVVSTIQSCSQGINKVVESLQQKFPAIPKTQLRNKVRELSDFVDNRWQVKKEILNKLGLSPSVEKGSGRMKKIATFFSKRCLPPADPLV